MLSRPLDQRIREQKYRCAQSLVFGLPVIALQYFGHKLGGTESALAVTIMQIVLTGWILVAGATGMISEGIVLIAARKKLSADLLVALLAVAIFLYSCAASASALLGGRSFPRGFHIVVMIIAGWSALRWLSLRRLSLRG
ncbi:hypothetical protein BH09PLA1_BH09PLA1_13470 [soil metagenome]